MRMDTQGKNIQINLIPNAMFDMIVYVSVAYSTEIKSTQEKAITHLNKMFKEVYKQHPTWAAVNALYSTTEDEQQNPHKTKACICSLMGASGSHIVLMTPGWEYCDIVLMECALAAQKGIKSIYVNV